MKYEAIQEIGGFKVGDEVPKEKAEVWMEMYRVVPVKKIDTEDVPIVEKKEIIEVEEIVENKDSMLDDYINRNANVVVKSIKGDSIEKKKLEKLLEIEKSDKNRKKVINAIKYKLKGMCY